MDPAVSLDRSSYTGKTEVASADDDGSDETAGDPLGLSQQKIKSTKVGRCANISKSNGHLSQDVKKSNMPKPGLNGISEPDVCGSSSNEISDLIDAWTPSPVSSLPDCNIVCQPKSADPVAVPITDAAMPNKVQCTVKDYISDHLHEPLYSNDLVSCNAVSNSNEPQQDVSVHPTALVSQEVVVESTKTVAIANVETSRNSQQKDTKVEQTIPIKDEEPLRRVVSEPNTVKDCKVKNGDSIQAVSTGVLSQQPMKPSDSRSLPDKPNNASANNSSRNSPEAASKPSVQTASNGSSNKSSEQPAKSSSINKTLASLKEVARKPRGLVVDNTSGKSSGGGKYPPDRSVESPVRQSGGSSDVTDAPRPNAFGNVSIRFSKKAMYDDSDDDEGTNIAISVAPIISEVQNEQSSSAEAATAADGTSSDQSNVQTPVTLQESDVAGISHSNSADDLLSPQRFGTGDTTPVSAGKTPRPTSAGKKKGWYSMLSSTYKSRSIEFNRIFKDIPGSERLIVDYSCALQRDILVQGRLYISRDWLCFYANILRWETAVMIRTKDIVKMTKEKTARVFQNAIQISTADEKVFFFTSFAARDKTYMLLDRVRKCATEDQPMPQQELWQWVHYSYGEELGLSDHDDDYVRLTSEEKVEFQTQMQQKLIEQAMDPTAIDATALNDGSIKDASDVAYGGDFQSSDSGAIVDGHSRSKLPSVSSNGSSKRQGIVTPELGSSSLCGEDLDSGTSSDIEDSSEGQKPEQLSNKQFCADHEHFEVQSIDEAFNITVDAMFQHLFTDSAIFRNYQASRKTFDIALAQWPTDADAAGLKVRQISYTLTLSTALGQKTSPSTERQVLYPVSRPGEFYLIDTEVVNGQIPYGENFYVLSRYCITRLSATRCHLRVTSQIKYRKNVWGFVKSFIDKNVTAGILDAFGAQLEFIREESNRHEPVHKRPRRQRQLPVKSATSDAVPKTVSSEKSHVEANRTTFSTETLIRLLCISLIILMLFNTFLLFKLWSVESNPPALRLPTDAKSSSPEEIVRLLDDMMSLIAELRSTVGSSAKELQSGRYSQQCVDSNSCS